MIAALMVVYHHCRNSATYFDGSINFSAFDRGQDGVDIFFVISGFLMVYVTEDRITKPLGFIAKRLIRVWPLYLLATIAATFLVFFAPSYFKGFADLGFAIKSAFFIPAAQYITPETRRIWPILIPGWSLNMEIVFYLLFGVALAFRARTEMLFASVTIFYLACLQLKNVSVLAEFYCSDGGVMLEFLIGVMIAKSYMRGARLSQPAALACITIGFLLLLTTNFRGSRLIQAGVPAGIIVLGAVNLRLALSKEMAASVNFWGEASYPLYLIHLFAMTVTYRLLMNAGYRSGDLSGVAFIGMVTVSSLLVSAVIRQYVEKPLTNALQSGRRRLGFDTSSSDRRHGTSLKPELSGAADS